MAGSTHQPRRGKTQLKPSEVCARFDVQPYVLKFWEGEFPQLGRRLGPKRLYGPREIEIVEAIHQLVEEQGLNLGEARDVLTERFSGEGDRGSSAGAPDPEGASEPHAAPAAGATQGGLFGQAEARIRELEKELERLQKLAEDERVRAGEQQTRAEGLAQELAEAHEARAELEERTAEERQEAEQSREDLQRRLDRAESARAVAMARMEELEGALEAERAEKRELEQKADDLSSLVETAGDAEQRLDAAREDAERLRRAFEEERRRRRERDRRLAAEVAEAMHELGAVDALAAELLEEISGQPVEPEGESSDPDAEDDSADDEPPYPDEEL
jgi:DNA-binding transcriptional MerR regulator